MRETNRKQERPARNNVLVRQQPWKFGHWNCRSLRELEGGELEQLMLERHFDALGLFETRLNSDGVSDLGRNYTIVCASDPERKAWNGVALIFNSLKMKLTRHRCQSDRVMVAWLSSRISSETFKIVVCYSPTNPDDEKGEKRVDCFYADLFRVMKDGMPSRKLGSHTLIFGVLNARISKEQLTEMRPLDGAWSSDQETNSNGENLLEFCSTHGLKIVNTLFKKPLSRLITWRHPRGSGAVIDYILSDRNMVWRDMRASWGGSTGHHSVHAKLVGVVVPQKEPQAKWRLTVKVFSEKA